MCRPFDSTPKNYEPNAGGHRGINTPSITPPQGVAIVGIYPCGKARNSPPGAVL